MILKTSRTPPKRVAWRRERTAFGPLLVGEDDGGFVCRIGFLKDGTVEDVLAVWKKKWPRTEFVAGKGSGSLVDAPVLLVGTPFQCAVWKVLASIPEGKTLRYAEVALRIGNARALRAVGRACGANPVPVLVPCHRVVAASGLGGFSGGLSVKKALLDIDGRK